MMIIDASYIVTSENLKMLLLINLYRITKKDLLIAEEIIDESDMGFENVSLDELDKIENY